MATTHTANVYLTNSTDSTAYIQLFHQNDSNGTQNASWVAAPNETVGPLEVVFETGIGSFGILDWWSVIVGFEGGTNPGNYRNAGTSTFPHWKECQLQSKDVGKDVTFTVSTTSFDVNLRSGGCRDGMARLGDFVPVRNVFVLMLENHSFDHLFGQSGLPGIAHAATTDTNAFEGQTFAVGSPAPVRMPTDPGHEFGDVLEQLCGSGVAYSKGAPYPPITLSGFASSYATTTSEGPAPPSGDVGEIMLGFDTPTQLPVLYQLATEFVLCDHWFSSLPGPTWPNRFFVHGASSAGLDHSPTTAQIAEWETVAGFKLPKGSIFDALTGAGLSWRLYIDRSNAFSDDPKDGSVFGGIPQVSALHNIKMTDVHDLASFAGDLAASYGHNYTFIEPNYGDVTGNTYRGGSSQHPMDDVYGGEGLVKAVYEAIRNSPVWNSSVLVITYDEHGGFFDSVPPPTIVAPGDGASSKYNESGFDFEQLGVRVPAIVVSPWVAKGVVDPTVYDHSSVPATIERLFGLAALTQRDAHANDLRHLFTAQTRPRTDAPTVLVDPAPPTSRVTDAHQAGPTDDAPVATRGNLPGFLAVALKSELELAGGTPAARAAVLQRFRSITTVGQARAFLQDAMARVDTAQSVSQAPVAAR